MRASTEIVERLVRAFVTHAMRVSQLHVPAQVDRRQRRPAELPNLHALNFVIENALGGGVTVSLAQDIWGKSLSNVMLLIELPERESAA